MDEYVKIMMSKGPEGVEEYLDKYVFGPETWNDYLELIGFTLQEKTPSQIRRGDRSRHRLHWTRRGRRRSAYESGDPRTREKRAAGLS